MLVNFERNQTKENLGRVLILGSGVTGKAVYKYLSSCSIRTDLVDMVDEDTLDDSKHYDLCVASPGISVNSDFFERAKKISDEIISEVEFAWRESEITSTWVAITGTNGKTTTTSLIAHILKAAGKNVEAVGNIGQTCISKVDGTEKIYVAECSSYQLTLTKNFCPKVACILNITPDHLIWHGSFEGYRDAKLKIFQNTKNLEDGLVFLDEETFEAVDTENFEAKVTTYFSSDAVEIVDEMFDDMLIKGSHNYQNAICATQVCLHLGVPKDCIVKGLTTFMPLEHRIEPCGEVDGVEYYNDSKATNVDSSIAALSAFGGRDVVVMFGGKDKMSDLSPLVRACSSQDNRKSANVVAIICYGEAGERFRNAFLDADTKVNVYGCDTFFDAFDLATKVAKPGSAVLLSPACASFDEFSCFEERGEVFKDAVKKLVAKSKCTGVKNA